MREVSKTEKLRSNGFEPSAEPHRHRMEDQKAHSQQALACSAKTRQERLPCRVDVLGSCGAWASRLMQARCRAAVHRAQTSMGCSECGEISAINPLCVNAMRAGTRHAH